jgi:hypothetical protein
MSVEVHIVDPGTGKAVKRVEGGAIAVAPVRTSLPFNATLGTDDAVVNVVPAKADHVFYITGIFLTGNKNIDATTAATVTVYTGDSETTAVANALTTLLTLPVARNSTRDINPILLETENSKWVNAVTTDDDVFVTIMGYYLRAGS